MNISLKSKMNLSLINNKKEIISISNIEREQAIASLKNFVNTKNNPPIISIGSTPTMFYAEHLKGITEVRAGIYMFWDLAQASRGICEIDEIALTVLSSVIGHNHQKGKILIDQGTKDDFLKNLMPEALEKIFNNRKTSNDLR